jgi:uncharacterized RDD family membrane protein YckC
METIYPELKTRIQSIFIDTIFIILLTFAAGWLFDKFGNEENDAWLRALVFLGLWGVYEPISMVFGGTIGNYLMKIKVRKVDNQNKKINLLQAYSRFIVKLLLGWISFVTIGFNHKKRAIHDFASGTVVIAK